MAEPDLLLLDEPTNHLDIPAIEGLERLAAGFAGGLVFTTHDRAFLERLATRIVEIDRGRVTSWPGDYANFLRRRDERWEAEEREAARFDRRLASEEAWLRRGLTARRIRNMGRLRRLVEMREERRARRLRPDPAGLRLALAEGERSGRRVIEAEDIAFGHAGVPIVAGFSCLVERGDRVGIIGPNGIGKTTLARLLIGDLDPSHGRVRHGTGLRTAWFDQERERLPEDATVKDAVADGGEFLTVHGRSVHVLGYLKDFLFSARRAQDRVRALSGGERNRLLLARLFARPSNLLVLDEPTNDLDIETLDVLEERLAEYDGTLLLVSHDPGFPRPPRGQPVHPRGPRPGAGAHRELLRLARVVAERRRGGPGPVPRGAGCGIGPTSVAAAAGGPAPPHLLLRAPGDGGPAGADRGPRGSHRGRCTRSSPTPRSTGSRRRSSPARAGRSARPRRSSKARSSGGAISSGGRGRRGPAPASGRGVRR